MSSSKTQHYCVICDTVQTVDSFDEFQCVKCGQLYSYNEGIEIELSVEQIEALKKLRSIDEATTSDTTRVNVVRFDVTQDGAPKFTVAPEFEPHAAWDRDGLFEEMVSGLEGKELRITIEVLGPIPDANAYADWERANAEPPGIDQSGSRPNTRYAGDNGGCLLCDSIATELAARGHRDRCLSPHAKDPPRPRSNHVGSK